jgi:isopenicillin-N N-acyltransferase-like protein
MRVVYVTPKSAANNMMVSASTAAGQGVAIDFECAPDETFQVHAEGGVLAHANHFVSPVALTKLRDTGVASTPCSLYRDMRVRDLLLPYVGQMTIEHVKTALFDDFGSPFSVCRPPRRNDSNNLSASVAMIVMQPAQGVMDVAMLPALNRQFSRFSLDGNAPARLLAAE